MGAAAIDSSVLQELEAGTDADFVRELIDTFLTEAPQMIADLCSARVAGNAEVFRRSAHSLKSNSLTFGANALGEMARELEHGGLGHAGDGAALDALAEEYARVAAALRELRNA